MNRILHNLTVAFFVTAMIAALQSCSDSTGNRIQHVKDLITAANLAQPTENNLFTQRYTTFKMSLP